MDSATQERNRNEAKTVRHDEARLSSAEDNWNIRVILVNQVHTQMHACSKQQHSIQKLLRGLKKKPQQNNNTQVAMIVSDLVLKDQRKFGFFPFL